jgi:hypothetical protein
MARESKAHSLCWTCARATWPKHPSGRRVFGGVGTCSYPLPALPPCFFAVASTRAPVPPFASTGINECQFYEKGGK